MMDRCYRTASPSYPNYGGRGIKVCARWFDFRAFFADMGPRPPGMFLERRDDNCGYSPTNCRWATRTENNRNRRSIRRLTYRGVTLSLCEWAERTGLNRLTISQRIDVYGWSVSQALTTPLGGAVGTKKLITYRGRTRSLTEWAKTAGMASRTLYVRLKKGLPFAEAIGRPKRQGVSLREDRRKRVV